MNRFGQDMRDEIAEGERWLAQHSTPPVSTQAKQRIKQAVRDELNRERRSAVARPFAPWHGGLAAAAVLALAVAIGWQSFERFEKESGVSRRADEEMAIAIPDPTDESILELEDLTDEDAWTVSGADLYDAMQAAFDEEWDSVEETSSSMRLPLRSEMGDVS